jgi:hypothetical protein
VLIRRGGMASGTKTNFPAGKVDPVPARQVVAIQASGDRVYLRYLSIICT